MNRAELMAKVAYEGEWSSWAWPGGYPLSYITSDGGELCPGCMNESTNPIHFMNEDNNNDGWLVVDAYSGAETDEEMSCDHCNKVMQEAFKETAAVTITEVQITPTVWLSFGCLVDSHHGQYMTDRIAEIVDMCNEATQLPGDHYQRAIKVLRDVIDTSEYPETVGRAWENMGWLHDEMEDKLNTLIPEGVDAYFGGCGDSGDWGLWMNDDDEDGE